MADSSSRGLPRYTVEFKADGPHDDPNEWIILGRTYLFEDARSILMARLNERLTHRSAQSYKGFYSTCVEFWHQHRIKVHREGIVYGAGAPIAPKPTQ